MKPGLLISKEALRQGIVEDLESHYPGFTSFPDRAAKWAYLKARFGDEMKNIHQYCGPNSVVVNRIVNETTMYLAHLSLLGGVGVSIDGDRITVLPSLVGSLPDCTSCYGASYPNGEDNDIIVCETDRTRHILTEELYGNWPGLKDLASVCLNIEGDKPLVRVPAKFGEGFRLEKHVGKYSGPMSKATYATTFRDILRSVSDGHCVIFDGTNTRQDGLEKSAQIARATDAKLVFAWCYASDRDVALNAQSRLKQRTFSEADEEKRGRFLRDHSRELEGLTSILDGICVGNGHTWFRVRTRDPKIDRYVDYLTGISKEKSLIVMIGEPLTGKTWLTERITGQF